jgi:hypothetical protein
MTFGRRFLEQDVPAELENREPACDDNQGEDQDDDQEAARTHVPPPLFAGGEHRNCQPYCRAVPTCCKLVP